MTRLAAVDCGTNSFRLLVADIAEATPAAVEGPHVVVPAPRLTLVERLAPVVRLGEGLERTGRLGEAALARAAQAADQHAARCAELGVERVVLTATAAARAAANTHELDALLRRAFAPWGAGLEVLSGEDEAELTFAGALTCDLVDPGPYLAVDSGGGSTELALGDRSTGGDRAGAAGAEPGPGVAEAHSASGPRLTSAVSLPLGCVTLHERLRWPDPPSRGDLDAAVADLRAELGPALEQVGAGSARTLIGLAGGATTLSAHAQHLPGYDSTRVDGSRFTVETLLAAATDLATMPLVSRRALPYLAPGRADVMGAAAAIWSAVLLECAALGTDRVVVSERDILDGLVLRLAAAAR